MFGSLFDDERPVGIMANVHILSVQSPPLPRLPNGLSGIENQGATCYLNSLLQTLLFTPEFRDGLFALTDAELGSLEERMKGGKVRIIPLQLQRLFARLLLVDQKAASTTELTDSFGWCNNEELQQHDVQELNRILFSAIECSLVGTSGKNLISELYHGTTVSEIVCQICGKISEKEEDFLDLNVIVANFSSLQDSLNATFLQKEIMKGKNQYRCSTCCNLVDAKKGLKIRCLPPILTFSLLRFSYDLAKGERYKESGKFVFPLEIDMSSYCDKQMKSDDSIYELFSVVIHSGSSYGGHYHAYIRDIDCLGKWLPPDEEQIVLPSTSDKNNLDIIQGPIALIKSLLLQQQDHCLPVEVLCMEMVKVTGLSWNKRFKSSHGQINKFLQKQDDMFFFNTATNMVYLKEKSTKVENAPESMCVDQSNPVPNCNENAPSSPKEAKKSSVKSTLKLSFFDKKKAGSANSPFGNFWFDFNDSKVSPVLVKDIEKQYSGKESAYMLFYRRKSLVRPEEAKCNLHYMMSEKLIELVEQENLELENLRDQHEIILNTITLQVHLGDNYTYCNGALASKQSELNILELMIDKRKLLADLRDTIAKVCFEICPDTPLVLHLARELPAGFHLHEELSPSQNHFSLNDLGVLEGTKIFVWDGSQVDAEDMIIGPAHEPVLLNIGVTLPTGQMTEISRGFPKSMTVGEFKMMLCDLVLLPLEDITLSRLDMQGEDTRMSPLGEEQDCCNLADLGLLDGDNLIAESSAYRNNLMLCNEITHPVILLVQNHCKVFEGGDATEFEVIELTVDPEITVADAKSLALSKLALDDTKHYRLSKYLENQTKRPPLHEDLTVRAAGLNEVSYLILEEGQPPSEEEITVMFSIGAVTVDTPHFEITVNKKISIQQCLKNMLCVAGLTGDNWHLRKTNWCGEPMEKLLIENATLENEAIQHGDCLLIVEGRLPPKGYVNFTVWLYPAFESLHNPAQPSINGLLPAYESLYKSIFTTNEHSCSLVKLGEVELSNESTLADLKKYVLTLPLLSTVSIPNVRYLRLRLLDGNRPSKVLRGLSNTLRKLKIPAHQSLCAQLLPREEDLMHNDLLLNISQRIPDSRTYTPPSELIWDTSKSASLKSFRQTLSDNLGIPIHRLVVAKHYSDKFQWLIMEDNCQKKPNKTRWGSRKSNLRHSPFFLKDGDTIGIKDRLADPDDLDDFTTQEDIIGQKNLKVANEGKRQRGNSSPSGAVKKSTYRKKESLRQDKNSSQDSGEWMLGGSDSDTLRHAKKSEIGITIHVDDFR